MSLHASFVSATYLTRQRSKQRAHCCTACSPTTMRTWKCSQPLSQPRGCLMYNDHTPTRSVQLNQGCRHVAASSSTSGQDVDDRLQAPTSASALEPNKHAGESFSNRSNAPCGQHVVNATASGHHAAPTATPPTASSSCPFLKSLQPPVVSVPIWQRVWQFTQPDRLQSLILAGDSSTKGTQHEVVQLEQQLMFEPTFVPTTATGVKTVLNGDGGAEPFSGPSLVPFFVRLMGPESLLVVSGQKHKYLRSLLSPAFSPEAVSRCVPQVEALVRRHLADWAAAGAQGVRGLDAIKLLTFEFIVELTLGRSYSPHELQWLHNTYQQWTAGLTAFPWLDIPFTPYATALKARTALTQHFQAAVSAGRTSLAAGQEVPGLLGGMLVAKDEAGSRLSDSQITDNIILLLLAGHDTSSTALTHTLSKLQDHPQVMEAVRAEQQAVIRKHGPSITAAALKDMPVIVAVIRETLRMEPVVQVLFRVALRDFELSGYSVPEGKQLLLPMAYITARDARWREAPADCSPDLFVPERMLTAEGQKAGDLMPFGHGPRYCLGSALAMAEMTMVLAQLARDYNFTADNKTEWVQTISKVPKNGLPLVLRPLQMK